MAAKRWPRPGFLTGSPLTHSLSLRCRAAIPSIQCRAFNNTTPIVDGDSLPPDPPIQTPQPTAPAPSSTATTSAPSTSRRQPKPIPAPTPHIRAHSPQYSLSRAPTAPTPPKGTTPTSAATTPDTQPLPSALRTPLANLATQPPHYIIIHIHGKPYLVTAGDTVRLPFLMHGVMPGDVIRLDRASQLGSREWTLRAGVAKSRASSAVEAQALKGAPAQKETEPIIGKTADLHPSITNPVPFPNVSTQLRQSRPKAENRLGYIDPSLFVCRATVLGVESEPLRVKEKTMRRRRHIRHITSKHRYTVLRISEVTVGLPGTL